VITSWTSQVTNIERRRNGTKPSKIITTWTPKCENNYGNQNRRCKTTIIGDNYTTGYASELSQNLSK
jgi:hypothetical protein